MGFPGVYVNQMLPKFLLVNSFSLLTSLKALILAFFKLLGLTRILDHPVCWPEPGPDSRPVSAAIIQDMLPAMKFSDAVAGRPDPPEPGTPEQCAVCLYEFRHHDVIRRLTNCGHMFHRACVDRWMDHDQMNCPLCRTPFVPYELTEVFHEKLGAASVSAIPEFGGEFSVINNFL